MTMDDNFDFKKEWEYSMRRQLSRLGKKQKKIPLLTYDEFQEGIRDARAKHNNAPTTVALRKLQPVLDQLNMFVNAITSIVQSSPDVVGFIWGSMQAVLTVASRFSNLLSTISDMFHNLASIIIQLRNYLALFPESKELQKCTRQLMDDYVGFSVSAYDFFKKRPFYTLLKLCWSTIDKEFEAARSQINTHYKEFSRTLDCTVDTTVVQNSRRVLDILPKISFSPAVTEALFHVPLLHNPHFAEREEELCLLWKSFNESQTPYSRSHRSTCLTGLGGIGKTSIALEYAYRYRKDYDFIFWIPSENILHVSNAAATISRQLGLGFQENTEKQPQLEMDRLRSWLDATEKPWLLILDNVEDLSTVNGVWPRASHGHVLLTSQKATLAEVCSSTILVQPLDRYRGSRLLLKHLAETQPYRKTLQGANRDGCSTYHQVDVEKAEKIVAELSGIPLVITFVAGMFSTLTLDEILNVLKIESSFDTIFTPDNPHRLVNYEKPFGRTWDIAQEQLPPTSLLLIRIMAMLSPTGVSEDLLRSDQGEISPLLGFTSIAQFHSMLSSIQSRHLVQRQTSGKGSYLLMHRIIRRHALMRLRDDPEELQRVFEVAFRLVLNVFPNQCPVQTPQNHLWEERERYSPHILSLCAVFESDQVSLQSVGVEFAEMVTDASSYFWERGLYEEAYQTIHAAEVICDRLTDTNAAKIANIYAISGAIRHDHGISQRLEGQRKRNVALKLRQIHLHRVKYGTPTDEDITCWGNGWNDLGCSLNDFGLYEQALPFLRLAWEQRERSLLCQKHYNHFPESPINVSIALAGIGNYNEAIEIMSETTKNTDKALGRDCAVSQTAHFTLAFILASAGRLDDAYEVAKQVYITRTKIFGVSNRQTSDAAYLVGTIEQNRGNLQCAKWIIENTLGRPNGWTEESKGRAEYRMGKILMKLGMQDEASRFIGSSKQVLEKMLASHASPKEAKDLSEKDLEVQFDLMVSITAGRSTMGHTKACTHSMDETLQSLCEKILVRFRGEVDSSLAKLCEVFNLEHDSEWLSWLDSLDL